MPAGVKLPPRPKEVDHPAVSKQVQPRDPKEKLPIFQIIQRLFPKSRSSLVWIAALCLGRTLLNDRLARLQGLLFKATFTRNRSYFTNLLIEDILGQLLFSGLKSTIDYAVNKLALRWRSVLNNDLETDYFSNMAYYTVAFVDKRIDSSEQIIADDTRTVSTELAEMALILVGAVIDGSYFTWRVSQQTSLRWASLPLLYVSGAIVVMQSVSPPFSRLYGAKQSAEEALRYAFSNLRANAEAIAAYGGDSRESSLVGQRMRNALQRTRELIFTQGWWGTFEDFIAKYCVTTVATMVIMIPFFRRSTGASSDLLQNAEMLSRMRYMTSITVFQLFAVGGLARFVQMYMKLRSSTWRLQTMFDVLSDIRKDAEDRQGTSILSGKEIAFQNVEVTTPAGVTLVKDLSFTVSRGTNLLITGPNGAGKSSIFRCLGSLWPAKKGVITKPTDAEGKGLFGNVFYLPQKPYNVVGDLRDQLVYPDGSAKAKAAISDERLAELLHLVDLEYLLERANTPGVNWEKELSLGETQRLAMARLFFHDPTYAILDECTSAVSNDMEERLYSMCAENGITVLTISHRPCLETFHHQKLELDGKGGYTVGPLEVNDRPPSPTISASSGEYGGVHGAPPPRPHTTEYPPIEASTPPPPRDMFEVFQRLAQLLREASPPGMWTKLLGVAGLVVFRVYLSDRMAHITGNNLRTLLHRDLSGFLQLQVMSLTQSAVQAIVAPGLVYMARSLAVDWREAISQHLYKKYFHRKAFYKVSHLYHLVEDADQRLTDDLDMLCSEMAKIFPDIVKPLADIVWFTYQSYLILGGRSTSLLYTYMFGGFAILQLAAPAFGALVEHGQQLAGAFRYVHTRLRIHAESIAFFGGDELEGNVCHEAFKKLSLHDDTVARASWRYEILNDFVIQRFPPIVTWALSFLYTKNQGDRIALDRGGQLSHDLRYVSATVSHTFSSFGELLELQKRLAELSGYAQRILDADAAFKAIEDAERDLRGSAVIASEDIDFQAVDVVTPSGACLVRGLSCTVPRHENLLVTGPNVSGKSSIFRVLGGLWPVRRGRLRRPLGPASGVEGDEADVRSVFLVPQKPYNAIGSLGEQITYPEVPDLTDSAITDKLTSIMKSVRLEHLVAREGGFAAVGTWANILSLGEQQRLGMARLFYHEPKFAVLDQCTDAVSVDVEEELYNVARERGITIVTISQRPALTGLHEQQLQLIDGAGAWVLKRRAHKKPSPVPPPKKKKTKRKKGSRH